MDGLNIDLIGKNIYSRHAFLCTSDPKVDFHLSVPQPPLKLGVS